MTIYLIPPSIPTVIHRACKGTPLTGKINHTTRSPSRLLRILIQIVAPPLFVKHYLLRPSGRSRISLLIVLNQTPALDGGNRDLHGIPQGEPIPELDTITSKNSTEHSDVILMMVTPATSLMAFTHWKRATPITAIVQLITMSLMKLKCSWLTMPTIYPRHIRVFMVMTPHRTTNFINTLELDIPTLWTAMPIMQRP